MRISPTPSSKKHQTVFQYYSNIISFSYRHIIPRIHTMPSVGSDNPFGNGPVVFAHGL